MHSVALSFWDGAGIIVAACCTASYEVTSAHGIEVSSLSKTVRWRWPKLEQRTILQCLNFVKKSGHDDLLVAYALHRDSYQCLAWQSGSMFVGLMKPGCWYLAPTSLTAMKIQYRRCKTALQVMSLSDVSASCFHSSCKLCSRLLVVFCVSWPNTIWSPSDCSTFIWDCALECCCDQPNLCNSSKPRWRPPPSLLNKAFIRCISLSG